MIQYVDVSKMSKAELRAYFKSITGKEPPSFNWIIWAVGLVHFSAATCAVLEAMK